MILRAVVGEEIVGRGLDEPGPYSMLEVLTPTLIDYARPELAAEMVPLLLSGRETWCQGFSEPGSGSDLASLSTRAEQRGDEWVVNGQKVWTSFAQYCDRCILLTRTGRPAPRITRHHRVLRRHGHPGHHRAPAAHHAWRRRVLRGVLRRRRRPRGPHARPARATAGGWRWTCCPYERSTCFWQRIAYLYSRLDGLIPEVGNRSTRRRGR